MKTLWPKPTNPYFIVAPQWTSISAGVRTLHMLCHALNISRQRAFLILMDGTATNKWLQTPPCHPDYIKQFDNPIVIYPDIIKGNPLNAKHVVRWLLGDPKDSGGDTAFAPEDHVWAYSRSVGCAYGTDNILCLPVIDPERFHNLQLPRYGSCYYAYKCEHYWGIEVKPEHKTGTNLGKTKGAMASVLQRSEVCYAYENTSVINEALLCGCKVVCVKNPKFTTVNAMPGWEMPQEWVNSEIMIEPNNALESYQCVIDTFWKNLKTFIKKTQAWKNPSSLSSATDMATAGNLSIS